MSSSPKLSIRMKRALILLEEMDKINLELQTIMLENFDKSFVMHCRTISEAIQKAQKKLSDLELTGDYGDVETPNPTYSR